MKMIRFSQTFWHCVNGASVPQFAAGQDYPVNEDTQRCVARGIAAEVEVDEPAAEPTGDTATATDAAAVVVDPAPAAAEAKPAKAKK